MAIDLGFRWQNEILTYLRPWTPISPNSVPQHIAPPDMTGPPSRRFNLGPAVLVTAAFIGPGTVLTASKAGAEFGFDLLWVIAFAVVTVIILQEMAARLGIISGTGLAESIRSSFSNRLARWAVIALVLGTILFGNSAYQTGNILGSATGLEILTSTSRYVWSGIVALTALIVIWIGRFDILQWLLTILVGLMGIVFLTSAVACGPGLWEMASGLRPRIPHGSDWIVIGLIGTTVVPYNLFLHASGAAMRYGESRDQHRAVRHSLIDTIVSIGIGGVITAALLVTAAVTFANTELKSIDDIANQLRPSLGAWAEYAFAIGLFAAGLTSAITAPVAAAYVAAGCLDWTAELSNIKLKLVATGVILSGLSAALVFGASPQQAIIIAQIANGMLLPMVAVFLLYMLNRYQLMGQYRNGWIANALGMIVVTVTAVIAIRQFYSI